MQKSDKSSPGVEFGRKDVAHAVAAKTSSGAQTVHIPSLKKDANTLQILENAVKGERVGGRGLGLSLVRLHVCIAGRLGV